MNETKTESEDSICIKSNPHLGRLSKLSHYDGNGIYVSYTLNVNNKNKIDTFFINMISGKSVMSADVSIEDIESILQFIKSQKEKKFDKMSIVKNEQSNKPNPKNKPYTDIEELK